MWRFALRNIFITFIINLAISLVISAVVGVVCIILSDSVSFTAISVVIVAIFACIFTFVTVLVLNKFCRIRIDWFGIRDYFDKEYFKQVNGQFVMSPKSSFEKFLVNCIRETRFYKAKDARLTFLPCLIIGVVLTAVAAVVFPVLYESCGNGDIAVLEGIKYVVLSAVLSASLTTWLLVGVLGLTSLGLNYDCCCQRCKALMPFIKMSTSDEGLSNATVVTLCASCGDTHFAEWK